MDQELRQYLDGKFADMNIKFADMDAKFADINTRFADINARFGTKQDLERVETSLLREFHKWASPAEARARTHTAAIRAIDLEIEAITERVQKLENQE
jgi:hypothetical protein